MIESSRMPSTDLDELFAVDPNEFVATRDRLVRELRAAGDKTGANELKLLRRPAVPIWALNQIARNDPSLIHTVVEHTASARRAQADVMSGGDANLLRRALADRRDAIQHVVTAALAVIERSGRSTATYERELTDTLNTIVADDTRADLLQTGRLVNLPSDTNADVDIFAGWPEPKRPRAKKPDERAAAARRELEEAEQRLRAAEDAHRDAIIVRDQAEQAFENAQRTVEETEQARTAARAAVDALTQSPLSDRQGR